MMTGFRFRLGPLLVEFDDAAYAIMFIIVSTVFSIFPIAALTMLVVAIR